jgi:hypothetical protein
MRLRDSVPDLREAIAAAFPDRARAAIKHGALPEDVAAHDAIANEDARHRRLESIEAIIDELVVRGYATTKRVHRQRRASAAADDVVADDDARVIYGNVLPVGLRAAVNVALVNAQNLQVRTLVNLEPAGPFNLMTCGPVGAPTNPGGCPIHGVTPRPRRVHDK